jgi:Rps23 Pro-64 3,4-dihydroxylase Tpa1-like proline 4-hydroxylase
MRLFLDRQLLEQVAAEHRAGYHVADPFPHTVIDGLFPDDVLDEVLREFPSPESAVWKEYDNYHERKLETQGEDRVGESASFLLYQLNSAPFLRFLETLTGIPQILPDPYFVGGGLHQITPGGKLGIHADYSEHGRLPLHRRVNVLVYLNKDWKEEYGGALELWSRDKSRCVRRILPVFNRTVIFTITDWAFHGHPDPMTCPEGTTRKSLALYYFTVDRPAGETAPGKVSTLFIRRPGEDVPEGTVFSRDGYTGLKGVPVPGTRAARILKAKQIAYSLTPPAVMRGLDRIRRR